jgi:hypothetical protein
VAADPCTDETGHYRERARGAEENEVVSSQSAQENFREVHYLLG